MRPVATSKDQKRRLYGQHKVNRGEPGTERKENSFWPPVGTRVCHPRNFREEGLWGPPIFEKQLLGAFLDNSAGGLFGRVLLWLGFSAMKPASRLVTFFIAAVLNAFVLRPKLHECCPVVVAAILFNVLRSSASLACTLP